MDLIKRENHIIDATDKVLGRLATQVVVLLRGKSKVGFAPYKDIGD
ncbi:MAG: 50S ribosomal protein L13, partial [Parcubacteria group bacterium GW2011_GWA1_33_6]